MNRIYRSTALGLGTLALSGPALAHHPLGGMPMETMAHGLLSGVGHPILGFDHLFFVALVGIAAVLVGRALSAPLAYVAAMLAGCLLTISGLALPAVELVIALSLLVLGAAVASGRIEGARVVLTAFAAFGLFHGAAFAGAITGQEGGAATPVLLGYLLGLGIAQYAVAVAAGQALRQMGGTAVQARLAGAAVAGIGVFLTLEAAEAATFAALGWG